MLCTNLIFAQLRQLQLLKFMIKQNLVSFFVKYLEEVGTTLWAPLPPPPDSQYLRKQKNIQILKCNDLHFLEIIQFRQTVFLQLNLHNLTYNTNIATELTVVSPPLRVVMGGCDNTWQHMTTVTGISGLVTTLTTPISHKPDISQSLSLQSQVGVLFVHNVVMCLNINNTRDWHRYHSFGLSQLFFVLLQTKQEKKNM